MTQDTPLDNLPGMPGRTRPARRRRAPIWLWIVAGAGLLIAIAVAAYVLMPLDAPIPDGIQAHYARLEQGTTAQGFPRLGSADAPVVVEDFSSYACSHCRDFHEHIFPGLIDAIAAGRVQFILVPVPHIGPGAENAARGMLCAGEQGQLWAMHEVLFYWQSRFLGSVFNTRRIKMGAENLGLDTAAFNACMDNNHPQAVLQQARLEFERRGLTGTPSFFINGSRVRDYQEFENLGVSMPGESEGDS